MSKLDERTGGWLLLIGGIVYFLFEWNATRLSPSWYESNFLSDVWPIQLGIHALAIALLVGGMALVGRDMARRGDGPIAWWAATGLVFLGLTVGKPALSAGLILVGILELRNKHSFVALLLICGAVLWLYVFLAGAHLGDANSRPPVGLERWAALLGLLAMCSGLAAIGWRLARTPDGDPVRGDPLTTT